MKRTRKWAYVAQEATRLAELGLTPPEIARRLELRPSTVQRWMQDGRLADTRRNATVRAGVGVTSQPVEWGKAVRSSYALDADDQELVKMGELALAVVHDPTQSMPTRLSAMGRFQAIVKQLALVARNAPAETEEKPAAPTERPMRRPGADPRNVLMAVK